MLTMARKRIVVPHDPLNPWPERLWAIRQRLNLSQAAAAARIEVSLRTWLNWENGTFKPLKPYQQLLEKLEKSKR